jgi:hypothetical protein
MRTPTEFDIANREPWNDEDESGACECGCQLFVWGSGWQLVCSKCGKELTKEKEKKNE